MTAKKEYLGDGVYAEYNGFEIVLTTENGIAVTNEIVMEPQVINAFLSYIEGLKARAHRETARKETAEEE